MKITIKTSKTENTIEVENNCSERKKRPFGQILPVLGRILRYFNLVCEIIEKIINFYN